MADDDLGYLLRRSIDERDMAEHAADATARTVHDQMADRYAALALEKLERHRETQLPTAA